MIENNTVFRPRAAGWVVGRRRPMATEIKFDSGIAIQLPDYLRGNHTGTDHTYRIVDILAVASNMKGFEDITVGCACVVHELESLPLDPFGDTDLVTFGGLVVQALVVPNE